MKNLLEKLKESAVSVLPIAVIVFILSVAGARLEGPILIRFAIGSVMMIIGMSLFNLGADISMLEVGNRIGSHITKSKKIVFVIVICFLIGFIITVAEPDLMVLADQLSSAVNKYALILSIAAGVAIFLVIAMLRIVFQLSLRIIFLVSYLVLFLLAAFTPKEFIPFSFDSGGVTTGPMSVPFIMALGIGIASTKSGGRIEDNFGLSGLCSVGPIIAVLILGFFADKSALASADLVSEGVFSFSGVVINVIKEVSLALMPILLFTIIFNFFALKIKGKAFAKILIGFGYVYIGLIIFLIGVNMGFAPIGRLLGMGLVNNNLKWLLVPAAVVIGFFTVIAEPAVHVLIEQVVEISGGTIKKRSIFLALMIGVAGALGLSVTRVLLGISIWWFIAPGYAIALALMFFVPKEFTAIAFDSGGIASGTMTAAFALPFAVGISAALGGNILTDAFGLVGFVAMAPLITLQTMGLIAAIKKRRMVSVTPITAPVEVLDFDDETIIEQVTDEEKDEDGIVDFDDVATEEKKENPHAILREKVQARIKAGKQSAYKRLGRIKNIRRK